MRRRAYIVHNLCLLWCCVVIVALLGACSSVSPKVGVGNEAVNAATNPTAAASVPSPSVASTTLPSRYELPGQAVFPEGIAVQPDTGMIFVNSIVDGTVYRGFLDRDRLEVFLPAGEDGRDEVVGMKLDARGNLLMAGGASGRVYVYRITDGEHLATLWNGEREGQSFLNDLAVAPDGSVYVTDSYVPRIYRLAPPYTEIEPWLDLSATVVYSDGINLNGIAVSGDGQYLLTVQLNTGRLYRIHVPSQTVTEVDLNGVRLDGGDGLLLDQCSLYVVQFFANQIVRIDLQSDFSYGRIGATLTDPSFILPTTIAQVGERLLVVNSQFDRQGGILATADALPPTLPFSVSSVQQAGASANCSLQ